jgi:nicotinamidase-related amidase
VTLSMLDASATLLVVDVQSGTLPNARSVGADELVSHIVELVSGFHDSGRRVVFLVATGTPGARTAQSEGGRSFPDQFTVIDDRLPLVSEDIILRRAAWSAFAATDLEQRLRDRETREIVVTGLATTFGIESTARSAADLGFHVVIASDAVSDPDPARHRSAIENTFPLLGRIATTSEILAALG